MTEKRRCVLEYCDKKHYAKGLCGGHYQQQWQGKPLTPLGRPSPEERGCLFDKCSRPHAAKGYCDAHWRHIVDWGEAKPIQVQAKPVPRLVNGKYRCYSCKQYLEKSRFSKNKGEAHGITSACKDCYNIRVHGLTKEQYDEIYLAQNGCCAICGRKPRQLVIDHDHACCPKEKSCGKCVRKLLCGTCNSGLGFFKDTPELLTKAAQYLKDHNAG